MTRVPRQISPFTTGESVSIDVLHAQ